MQFLLNEKVDSFSSVLFMLSQVCGFHMLQQRYCVSLKKETEPNSFIPIPFWPGLTVFLQYWRVNTFL